MLKTNSKKAIENIKKYIVDHFDCSGYDLEKEPETFPEIARFILNTCAEEKRYSVRRYFDNMTPSQETFIDWAQGLPGVLDTCYYYNRSAVKDLGDILEETETERNKFSEQDAERMLSCLIYRELTHAAKK